MRAVILDRDGVINHDSDEFVKTPEEWVAIPGSLQAIARLHRAGFVVAVATNQSGVGRGLLTLETLRQIHARMLDEIRHHGGAIARIAYCPHLPDAGCDCRKPAPGLLHELAQRLNLDLKGVPVVGDSERDLIAARRAGASPVLVRTGKGLRTLASSRELPGIPVFDDLAAFVDDLLAGEREPA
jgi:D-glycero-D-manno-heptose 1,7-bisphosphate phosphatase